MAVEKNHYEVLGVPPSSDDRFIRAAYLKLVQQCHPDTGNTKDRERFSEITDSYGTLKNVERRRVYDAQLRMLEKQCDNCDGAGTVFERRGFTGGSEVKCPVCKGTGRA